MTEVVPLICYCKYISSRADCEIQTIDHAALEKIKSVITAERLEYEPAYSELLTEIANAAMRQKMLVAENEISLLSGIDTGFEIRNHKTKFELLIAFLVESYSGDYVEYDIENRLPFVG